MTPTPPSALTAAEGEPRTPAAGDPAWRRLSPRMLLVQPIQELLRAVPALAGLLVAGSGSGHGGLWSLVGVVVVAGIGTLRWFTTTYRVSRDQVQVRRGLLRRRLLTVPRDRVRTVDVTANPMHRLLGLTRVSVGTGRSDRKDDGGLKLDGLNAAAASRLREELLRRTPGPLSGPSSAPPGVLRTEVELARLRPGWVWYGPFTLSGLISVSVVAAFLWRIVSETNFDVKRFGPLRDVLDQVTRTPRWIATIGLVCASLAVVAAASTIGYLLAFWDFRLTRQPEGTLQVTRGLVTTRATTIEERRLRGIELSEPLLLRAVRGARCIAVATGLRVGRGAERGGSLLLPPAPRSEARRVAAEVLGAPDALTAPLIPHGPSAARRRFTRALGACAMAEAALVLLWWQLGTPAWTWQASMALFPCGAVLAADRYRSLGHALIAGSLVTRLGTLVRRRIVLACDGIIGWNLHRSFVQRRLGLATLTATTAAGRQGYSVEDVSLGEALRIAEEALPDLWTPFRLEEGPLSR